MIFAILADVPAIPPNPNAPAISAIINNAIIALIIIVIFF